MIGAVFGNEQTLYPFGMMLGKSQASVGGIFVCERGSNLLASQEKYVLHMKAVEKMQ